MPLLTRFRESLSGWLIGSHARGMRPALFVVFPKGAHQDTLVVGPDEIASGSNDLIGWLYDRPLQIGPEADRFFRVGQFRGLTIAARSHLVPLKEEIGSRTGLILTIGLVMEGRANYVACTLLGRLMPNICSLMVAGDYSRRNEPEDNLMLALATRMQQQELSPTRETLAPIALSEIELLPSHLLRTSPRIGDARRERYQPRYSVAVYGPVSHHRLYWIVSQRAEGVDCTIFDRSSGSGRSLSLIVDNGTWDGPLDVDNFALDLSTGGSVLVVNSWRPPRNRFF